MSKVVEKLEADIARLTERRNKILQLEQQREDLLGKLAENDRKLRELDAFPTPDVSKINAGRYAPKSLRRGELTDGILKILKIGGRPMSPEEISALLEADGRFGGPDPSLRQRVTNLLYASPRFERTGKKEFKIK